MDDKYILHTISPKFFYCTCCGYMIKHYSLKTRKNRIRSHIRTKKHNTKLKQYTEIMHQNIIDEDARKAYTKMIEDCIKLKS